MKTFVMCSGMAAPHAGWVAIDELAQLFAQYFGADILSPARAPDTWWRRAAGRARTRYCPQDCAGGDLLMVVAHAPDDLALVAAIPDVRRKFQRIVGFVTDSYFQAGFVPETALYDLITVTAREDMAYPAQRFGVPVQHLYQGTDALRWAPRGRHARDIDVIAFGRTPPSYHRALSQRMHAPESPFLYLHSPLGHISGPEVHLERGMLFKLLHRTRISLAFHLLVEPQGDRPRSMMVTSRWLESLLSGCIVAGRRPVSQMADDMLFWPGATVELAQDPAQACAELEELLARNDSLQAQRSSNTRHVMLHHDWRYRIETLCGYLGADVPPALRTDIMRLREAAGDVARADATP